MFGRIMSASAALLLAAGVWAAPLDGSGERAVVFENATIYPISSEPVEGGLLVIREGVIEYAGPMDESVIPEDSEIVDATGKHILPGLIDAHSHMGVYSWPHVDAHSDGNEMTSPITPHVHAEDAINLEDPAFARALAGGVTTVLVLPGSGNMIGGEAVVIKLRPDSLLEEMKFEGAPRHLKMAMGENPKRVYGGRGEMPSTRMGIMAKHREVWTKAQEYAQKWQRHHEEMEDYIKKEKEYEASDDPDAKEPKEPTPPERDRMLEVLADVLAGEVRVNVHCYRKDDLMDIMRISDEFGFQISSFHHVLEGYKIADELAKRGIGACTWPDWWGFKMEAYDAVPENMAIMANAGVTVALHSDSSSMVQRFPYEAAKAVKYGMTKEQALESITINPAKLLGIDDKAGTLEEGKVADIAVFSGDPFDIYTLCDMTFVDGRQVWDRASYNDDVQEDVFARYLGDEGAAQ